MASMEWSVLGIIRQPHTCREEAEGGPLGHKVTILRPAGSGKDLKSHAKVPSLAGHCGNRGPLQGIVSSQAPLATLTGQFNVPLDLITRHWMLQIISHVTLPNQALDGVLQGLSDRGEIQ